MAAHMPSMRWQRMCTRFKQSSVLPFPLHPTRASLHNKAFQKTTPAFCFDIDGVLKQGSHVLPEGREALRILSGNNSRNKKYPFVLCTNGGGVSESIRAAKLTKELGVEITEGNLVQSHTIFRSLVPKYGKDPVLVVGGSSKSDKCRRIAEEYGFTEVYTPQDVLRWNPSIWPFQKLPEDYARFTKEVDFSDIRFAAILVMHDPQDWGISTQLIIDLLTSPTSSFLTPPNLGPSCPTSPHIPIHFSNPDLLWGNEFPRPRFGQGAFQEAVRANYRRVTDGEELEAIVGGKPNRPTYEFAEELLNGVAASMDHRVGNVYMIGDNPYSDIQGANDYGWTSILVRTGVFQGSKITTSILPWPP